MMFLSSPAEAFIPNSTTPPSMGRQNTVLMPLGAGEKGLGLRAYAFIPNYTTPPIPKRY